MATLRDVADLAGVSIKTVSNVVNGYVHVSDGMRTRVQRAIEELDYRPNIAARNLRRGRTGLIALGIPSFHNPYYAEIAQLIVSGAEEHGLTVLVDCTRGSIERERLVLDGYRTHMVDGLILCPRAIDTDDLADRRDPTPLVLLGEREQVTADTVAVDSREVSRLAVEHLLAVGRRRIGIIGFSTTVSDDLMPARRLEGARQALRAAGHEPDGDLVRLLVRGQTTDDAAAAAVALVDEHPEVDALFCFNDEIGVRVVRDLIESGRRVPEDVAVVGVDDIDVTRVTRPGLTTVAPDKAFIAEQAVARLLARVEGGDGPPQVVTAPIALIERASTVEGG